MQWTNVFNIDAPLAALVRKQTYSMGNADISATGLLKPPLLAELERRKDSEIIVDVSEGMWRALGTLMHGMIEEHGTDEALHEEEMFIEREGWRIAMHFDRFHRGEVVDWKMTTKWRILRDLVEWKYQLNMYAVGLREHGFTVRALSARAILRDHHWSDTERFDGMPPIPFHRMPFRIMDSDAVEALMSERLAIHSNARSTQDIGDLSPCTPEDRWRKGERWAVRKLGGKTASPKSTLYCDSEPKAQELAVAMAEEKTAKAGVTPGGKARKNPDVYEAFYTAGEDLRCKRYCSARFVCPFNRETPWSPSDSLVPDHDDPNSIPF